MLVFGDAVRYADPSEEIAALEARVDAIGRLPGGLERHAGLIAALIQAGELAQGLADAAAAGGVDEISCTEQAALHLAMDLARAAAASWRRGFAAHHTAPQPRATAAFQKMRLPGRIEVRTPEGYAFYALYPEAYYAAASALPAAADWRVVGIRSIGSSLATMVAAGLGASAPMTVRPKGHPFQRQVSIGPKLAARLHPEGGNRFALVDEGPGLSGSSLGGLADYLEGCGIRRDQIHMFPGHGGDLGGRASAAHRDRWRSVRRSVVDFESLWLNPGDPRHLQHWAADLVGPADAPLVDIGGGRWRERSFASAADWPACDIGQERRKFILRAEGRSWLLKFAGLGVSGEAKLALGLRLAEAGLTPPIAGLRHGFLVQRWLEDARPVDPSRIDRPRMLERISSYLAFRALALPTANPGASVAALHEMALFNIEQGIGAQAAARLQGFGALLPALAEEVRPVPVDGRMHPHEWIETEDGVLLKTDALDHHAGHDLVGCQDIAWDIAGASVEFALSSEESDRLRLRVGRQTGRTASPTLLAFHGLAYTAFHLGRCSMAARSLDGSPEEQARLEREAARYERVFGALSARLSGACA